MNITHKLYRHFFIACFLVMLGSFNAQAKKMQLPSPLVSSEWLDKHIDTVTVLDIRADADSFRVEGHIPTASLIMLNQIRASRTENGQTVPGMVVSLESFEQLMQKNGVSNNKPVVVTYAGQSVVLATRLYWTLKYYGHKKIALLDGGNHKWTVDKLPIIHTVSTAYSGKFKAVAQPKMLATKAEVLKASRDENNQILDARSLPFFLGKTKKQSVQKAGHIPSASLLPQSMMADKDSNRSFSSTETLTALLKSLDIKQSAPSITYCNSGLTASGPWFVMHELLGNKETKLYDGSMLEWAADEAMKVETGKGE